MFSLIVRVSLFTCMLAGPLCAMKISQERSYSNDASTAGLVLINSLQRG